MKRRARHQDLPYEEDLKFKKPVWSQLDEGTEVKAARKLGAEHGKVGVPGANDHDCAAFNRYRQIAERTLAAVAQDWNEMNRVLRGEWSRLRPRLGDSESQVGPLRAAAKKIEKLVDDKQRLYDERRRVVDALDAHHRHRIGPVAYVLGLAAVFLIDVPLNSVVFQIFGEDPISTFLLAALLGILLVPAAHLLGIQMRNGFPDRIAGSIATAVPLLLIFGIAYLRTQYLEATNSEVLTGLPGVLIFLTFNLAVFTSAIVLSYLRHDPHEQAIEEAARELKKAQAVYAAERARLKAQEEHAAALRGRLAELRAQAEAEFKKAKNRAREQRNFFEQLMQEYRMENQASRERPGEVIHALEEWEKPSLPPDLRDDAPLDWEDGDNGKAVALPAAG